MNSSRRPDRTLIAYLFGKYPLKKSWQSHPRTPPAHLQAGRSPSSKESPAGGIGDAGRDDEGFARRCVHFLFTLPSGSQTWLAGKSHVSMEISIGKSSIHGAFSIAMFDYWRVFHIILPVKREGKEKERMGMST